jgi:putative transposase
LNALFQFLVYNFLYPIIVASPSSPATGPGESRCLSGQKRGEAAIWQRRFWEHAISDDDDLDWYVGIIYFNPVRHGLVKKAKDGQWSSFHRYVQEGYYDADWGRANEYWGESKFGE